MTANSMVICWIGFLPCLDASTMAFATISASMGLYFGGNSNDSGLLIAFHLFLRRAHGAEHRVATGNALPVCIPVGKIDHPDFEFRVV
jgi:hypothetical protein